MNRRNFLKHLGLILLNSTLIACGAGVGKRIRRQGKRRIIVVGAGLAGLAAAKALKSSGHEVVVLEARDRIGGRIWTSTKWPDLPLDLGATWIHGDKNNPMTTLADEIQAQRLVTSYDRAIAYDTSGARLSDALEVRLDDIRAQVYRRLQKAQVQDPDVSVRQAVATLEQQFQSSSELTRFLNFVLNSEIEHEYSGSAQRLSAHWYDSVETFDGDDVLFVHGFETIINYLAEGLQIERSQTVKAIHWGQADVQVVTQKTEFEAEHVIVTLPLGVLKSNHVHFRPELPNEIRQAIVKLGMGVLNKCYFRFEQAFWPVNVDWLEYVSAQHGEWTEWVSFKRVADIPVLLGFNAADYGRAIEAWSDGHIVESGMETLKTIFGKDTPQPIDYQITRWAMDPFAQGSYSYNALGSMPAMRNQLAAPVDSRLFFAGEATHKDYFGTAHGAYLSGLRAAKGVLST